MENMNDQKVKHCYMPEGVMARIRTIKPELWTDERLTECSLSARLLFIGMLNFADDNGNQAYSAKRLKMQVFPADSLDTQPLLDELLTHGVIMEYSVNGEKFLHIKGFLKHQVINRPSPTRIPKPTFREDSVSAPGAFTVGREGKGKELQIPVVAIAPVVLPGFAQFWETWPSGGRKQAKGACLKAWEKARAESETPLVIAHVLRMTESREWVKNSGEFIPAPLVYLNQRRWDGANDDVLVVDKFAGSI